MTRTKEEITKSKSKDPKKTKSQIPIIPIEFMAWDFGIFIWSLDFGAWDFYLELGIWILEF
jgi:hypothetical protein